jgi:multiphosphoryl transfer protein
MVGIVVVSHSRPLAKAAVELARAMVPTATPVIAIAAGAAGGGFGTDAAAVADAIAEVTGPDGVLVLTDLGSALLATELALELHPPAVEVRMSTAPFVEGLLGAVVRAVGGGTLDQVEAEALAALAAKVVHLGGEVEPNRDAATETLTLVNPLGLHARPAAQMAAVVGNLEATVTVTAHGRCAEATSPSALMALRAVGADAIEVRATGPEAGSAVAAVRRLVEEGFGELDMPTPEILSRGVASAPVVRHDPTVPEPPDGPPLDPSLRAAEAERLDAAVQRVADAFRTWSDAATGQTAEILKATAVMATDPAVAARARALLLDDGVAPGRAAWVAFTAAADRLARLGGSPATRAVDVRDVRDRVVADLHGLPMPRVPERSEPFVLVAPELAPADAARLARTGCVALVTERGGPTHTAIIAREVGLPMVVTAEARDLREGTLVEVDGGAGLVRPVARSERIRG